jgi:glycine/serine hydroxymethyltransferase
VPDVNKNVIPFEASNKYMESSGDRLGMAKELIENGRI